MRALSCRAGVAILFVVAHSSAAFGQKVGTHFFYWYDAPSNNVNQAKMPFHPPGLSTQYSGTYYSSLSTAWYQWQLADMKQAGMDYIFPVSWGQKYQTTYFKQSVLSRLVDAIHNTNSGLKIGLYDDTQSEACEWNSDNGRGYVNSTTDPSLQLSLAAANASTYFYTQKIKPFFQMIPRDQWATHNGMPIANGGRPMIAMFTIYYYKDYGSAATLWQTIKNSFTADFGVTPWVMPDFSWWYFGGTPMNTVGDGEVIFGAACTAGQLNYTTPNGYKVGNLGPGCDARLVPRPSDYVPRWQNYDAVDDLQDDQWLHDNWHALPNALNFVLLETWNELWEGTSLSRCVDFPHRTGGVTTDTFYMDKNASLVREYRDRTAAPASLQNGSMDGVYTSGLTASWTPYWVYGDVTLAQDTTNKHGGTSAQKVSSSSWKHLAGVYQQVAATSGTSYNATAWTWRHDDWNNGAANEETWVGIDPTGGVDATSANIVWSGSQSSYQVWTQQSVTTTASSNRITVFLRGRANFAGLDMRANYDDVTLAAVTPGAISGTVTASGGGVISGATVSTNVGGYTTTTNGSGVYTLSSVAVGTYNVTASKTGYASSTVNSVAVSSGATTTVNFTLSLATPIERMVFGNIEGGFWATGWGGGSAIPNGWQGWYNPGDFNCFDETTTKHAGSHAAKTTISAGGNAGTGGFKRGIIQNITMSPNASFTFTVWARHTNGNCPSIMCWNPDGDTNPENAYAAGRYQWVTTDNWGQVNTWVSRSMTGTAPASGNVTIICGGAHHGGGGAGTVYIDDVSVMAP